jgi:hypothetical protein
MGRPTCTSTPWRSSPSPSRRPRTAGSPTANAGPSRSRSRLQVRSRGGSVGAWARRSISTAPARSWPRTMPKQGATATIRPAPSAWSWPAGWLAPPTRQASVPSGASRRTARHGRHAGALVRQRPGLCRLPSGRPAAAAGCGQPPRAWPGHGQLARSGSSAAALSPRLATQSCTRPPSRASPGSPRGPSGRAQMHPQTAPRRPAPSSSPRGVPGPAAALASHVVPPPQGPAGRALGRLPAGPLGSRGQRRLAHRPHRAAPHSTGRRLPAANDHAAQRRAGGGGARGLRHVPGAYP